MSDRRKRSENPEHGPPGGMQLMPGYKHEKMRGYDTAPGTISNPDGVEIHYDVGEVPKPGGALHGGHFVDRARAVPRGELRWYKEMKLHERPVHLAYTQGRDLLVAYPESGMNFSARAKSDEELVDALLMILSYAPGPDAG